MTPKEKILAANDRPSEVVPVPEWDFTVHVKTISGADRDQFDLVASGQDRKNFRSTLLVFCLYDEEGNRIFSPEEIGALGEKSAKVLDRLFDVARRLNGVMWSDKEVEAEIKNSGSGAS